MPYANSRHSYRRKAAASVGYGGIEAKAEQPQPDIYQRITDQIVAAIEAGAGDWRMPWHCKDGSEGVLRPVNFLTGKPYRGVNVLALWIIADAKGYASREWGTYKQWEERGAQVRKGEKSACIVFWKIGDKESSSEDAEGGSDEKQNESCPVFARGYAVFNADQVDGYTSKTAQPADPIPTTVEAEQRINRAEQFFIRLSADIRYGGNRAFYRPSTDYIQMPPFAAFHYPIGYYSTLSHEAAHWTSAKHRLDRELSGRFGSEAYAAEELIAELSAAFLSADLELTNEPRPDHAAYVASWLKVLKNDSRAIFTAAAKAQQAVDYLHGLQDKALLPESEIAVSGPVSLVPNYTPGL